MTHLPERTPVYFDPTTDFGFKKLFGEEANKDLLKDFLNSMLSPKHQISSLSFQKTEQLPDHEDDRKTIYDILCQDINGERFIVEMQKSRMTYLMDRAMYYTTFPIQSQAPKGKWNFKLSPVFVIGILDFDYDKDLKYWKERRLLRSFSLIDDQGVQMMDNLHFMFLQLPFFTKEAHQLETQFDKWCFFLKNLETMDSIPAVLNETVFQKAFDVAELSNMEKNDWILYQISKSKKYDMEVLADEAEQRGMERGMEKRDIENILNIHDQGYTPSQIVNLLSLPIEKVMDVLQNHGLVDVK
jgi:predicted transposase/invertase (TIGR01784 family)